MWSANPIVFSVQPRPAAAVGNYWLPASAVTLSAAWNPTKLSAQTGDPLTLDLDLQATGLTAAQLPDLSSLLSLPSGLKAYPDQPKLDDSTRDGKSVGSRDQTIALMADSPGRYTIPVLTVKWWDKANQLRTATLPARTLTILPAPGNTAAAASAPPAPAAQLQPLPIALRHAPPTTAAPKPTPIRSSSEWEWISIGLAVMWLATLGAWLWSRRSRAAPPPGAPPSQPARANSGPIPRKSAQRFAQRAKPTTHKPRECTNSPGPRPSGALPRQASMPWPRGSAMPSWPSCSAISTRACYAGGAWQGGPLAAALTELPAPPGKTGRQRDGLAPLYP